MSASQSLLAGSMIVRGEVMHARLTPLRHEFRYPLYFYVFDVDELPALPRMLNPLRLPFFQYNRPAVVSVFDQDFLKRGREPLRAKALALLRERGFHDEIVKIYLVTSARYFGYVFNPVSFYCCYTPRGDLRYGLVEINNTFSEKHTYALDFGGSGNPEKPLSIRLKKEFHVSPFYDMSGEYEFRFSDVARGKVDFHVNIVKEGKIDFVSRMWGAVAPLTCKTLLATIARYPVTASLSLPRIFFQAGKLYYLKNLPVYTKPNPSSVDTIREANATFLQRWAVQSISRHLNKIQEGYLEFVLPEGEVLRFGDASSRLQARVEIRHYRFFTKALFAGGVGLGESYVDGDWESADIVSFLKLLVLNRKQFSERSYLWSIIGRGLNSLVHSARRNTIDGSRKNIQAHYDTGNEFFKIFLDPCLTYSCGIFASPETSLEDAQQAKLRSIIEKAHITSGNTVLEIGSGWGSMAIEIARTTEASHITTITLSEEQHRLVTERIEEAGLSERISVKLCDYRHVEGKYDRIISVEMLEAVGKEYLGSFFTHCDRLLAADGLVVVQVITMPDDRYGEYAKSCDWIQKHIFPGAHVPSLGALSNAVSSESSLIIEDAENIGPHYAPTLRIWRKRLVQNAAKVYAQGYDERFLRLWEYYFAYCEAGFATRMLNVAQLVFTRSANRNLMTRDSALEALGTLPDFHDQQGMLR